MLAAISLFVASLTMMQNSSPPSRAKKNEHPGQLMLVDLQFPEDVCHQHHAPDYH